MASKIVIGSASHPPNASGFIADQPGTMRDLARADTLIIIIGSENIHTEPPTQLIDALRAAHQRHSRIVGICSGAFVLAHAGLLDHRRATTHWMHIPDFTARFPTVALDPSVLYVEDRGIFTSAGTAAAIDLSLELVRQDFGRAPTEFPAHGHPAASRRGQAQYLRWPMPAHPDQSLADALRGLKPTSTNTSPSTTSPDSLTSAGGPLSAASTTPWGCLPSSGSCVSACSWPRTCSKPPLSP